MPVSPEYLMLVLSQYERLEKCGPTTREIAALTGVAISTAHLALLAMEKHGLVRKGVRGWVLT